MKSNSFCFGLSLGAWRLHSRGCWCEGRQASWWDNGWGANRNHRSLGDYRFVCFFAGKKKKEPNVMSPLVWLVLDSFLMDDLYCLSCFTFFIICVLVLHFFFSFLESGFALSSIFKWTRLGFTSKSNCKKVKTFEKK